MQHFSRTPSPVGQLKLVSENEALIAVLWENDPPNRVRLKSPVEKDDEPVLVETKRQLAEYFAGQRTEFTVPIFLSGTDFQIAVWKGLQSIPFAQTWTYGQLASRIDNPKAVRAVGAANGKNPISIIIPCHRVIGASGKLTGFAGGLTAKEQLLDHETRHHALSKPRTPAAELLPN